MKHDGDYVISVVTQEAEPAVKAEVTKARSSVVKLRKARIDVSVGEKLAIRELELSFAKLHVDIKSLMAQSDNISNDSRLLLIRWQRSTTLRVLTFGTKAPDSLKVSKRNS